MVQLVHLIKISLDRLSILVLYKFTYSTVMFQETFHILQVIVSNIFNLSQISTCGCSTQRSLANSVAIVGKMDSNTKMCSLSSTFASAPNFWEINLYCRWFVLLLPYGVQNITEAPILCQFLSTSIMTTILTPSKSHLLIWTMSK